jgi:ribosomal protein S8
LHLHDSAEAAAIIAAKRRIDFIMVLREQGFVQSIAIGEKLGRRESRWKQPKHRMGVRVGEQGVPVDGE